jgi:hypothetical protein
MSEHDHDFDEFLRRLLREEADAVEPAGDGLERIQARLTRPRPALVVWVMAVFSGAWHRLRGAAQSASVWLRTMAHATSARLRSARGGSWRDAGSRRWRSPAVLGAAAVVAVAASVLALSPLPRQAVSGTAALFHSFGGAHGGGGAGQGGGQAEGGGGAQPAPSATSSSPSGKHPHPHPSASPSPSAAPSPTPGSGNSTPPASPSPTPAASSTPCPSPSVTPSPGAGSSASPGPGACPTPTPTTTPTTGATTDPPSSPASTPGP